MRIILICTAVFALVACQKPAQQSANEAAPAAEQGPHKGVDRSHRGQAAPKAVINLARNPVGDMEGRPTLINLWATWCAPCVKELPTLDRLAMEHEDRTLAIWAISQDDGPRQSVEAFLKAKAPDLEPYQDPKMSLSAALGPDTVLPTSILYDAKGKEVWRYVGDLDWTSPEAAKLLAEGGVGPKKG